MTYAITDQLIGAQPIDSVSTTQRHPLGLIVDAVDPTYGGGEFIYLKGVSDGAAGAWVTYNIDDGSTTLLVANAIGPVGVMVAALDASTDYGWVQISGKVSAAQCLTGHADGGLVFATASAGFVDDASVTGDLVNLAKAASTSTARSAEFEIHRPFVNDKSTSVV